MHPQSWYLKKKSLNNAGVETFVELSKEVLKVDTGGVAKFGLSLLVTES